MHFFRRDAVPSQDRKRFVKAFELKAREPLVAQLRLGEVRADAFHLEARHLRERPQERFPFRALDADPVHAGVDFEMHGQRSPRFDSGFIQ